MLTDSATPPSDFANALALPAPGAKAIAPAGWLLCGLVLLCLVPRAIEAWKIDTLCKDGVFYVQLGEGFGRGEIEAGLGRLRLNTYPLILSLLHRCGLDWEQAAEAWGVLISSLVVLPLFGWIRRQFDDRVAIAACFLYAVHPKFIEWSPEAIRDPTFWFFWSGSLYASWRAVTEVRLKWFMAAGVAITLALHTRFEGWVLYLPLVWWSACRCWSLIEGRWRVAGGTLLALAASPALLLLVNLTWLHSQPRWELGNFTRLEYVVLWYQAAARNFARPQAAAPSPTPVATGAGAAHVQAPEPRRSAAPPAERADIAMPRMPAGKTALVFVNALRRGIGGLFGLLWLIGFVHSRRLWFRRDQVVLFLAAACVAAGIWIHLWYAQATSSRYFLTIDLLASACAGLGWLKACEWLSLAVKRLGGGSLAARAALTAALLLAVGAGVGQAVTNRYTGRQRDAALGLWLKERFGSHPRLATGGSMELVDHYAGAIVQPLPLDREAAARVIADWQPVCVVAWGREMPPGALDRLRAAAEPQGFQRVADARLPHGFDWHDFLVLERRHVGRPELELARQSNSKP